MLTATVAAACFVAVGSHHVLAQDGETIVLPTVEVETTQQKEPAAAVAAAKQQAAAASRRAAQRAAAARAQRQADAAAARAAALEEANQRAEAEARAVAEAAAKAKEIARGNPYADPDAPFKSDRLANSRLPGSIADTPRTVTAIGKEVLEATGMTSVREIARTTPGISLGFGEGGNSFGDNIYIRGFKANNDLYVDGIRDSGTSVHETFNTEQIEVIKGPAGTIGGRGTTGGALDIVSKKAKDVSFFDASTTLTSAKTKRATIDFNHAFNEQVQIRMNALVQDGNVAGRDNVEDDRRGFAAAATIKPSDQFTIEADVAHTVINQTPDWGVPYMSNNGGPVTEYGVDRATFYGVVGRDYQDVTQTVGTIKTIYELNDSLKLSNTARYSHSINDYVLTAPSSLITNGSNDINDWQVALSFKSRYQETDVFSDVLELAGETMLGGVAHTYVAGLSYSDERVNTRGYQNLQSEDYLPPAGQRGCTVTAVNPNPVAEGCWAGEAPVLGNSATLTKVRTTSLYALDTIELNEQWLVNGGVRVDFYDNERSSGSSDLSRKDTLFNWNAGITYKPWENTSLYAAIASSSNPSGQEIAAGGSFYGGLDDGGALLSPERNMSYEVGVKYEYSDNLLLTAAVFQTVKSNAREDYDPDGRGGPLPTQYLDTLKYRMSGVELGVSGNLTDRISLFGGVVLMDSEILESFTPSEVGKDIANIAHQQFSLLGTYKYNDQLTLGARVTYAGGRNLGSVSANGNTLPDYTTFDLLATYEFSEHAELQFNVTNVADTTYYDSGYRSGSPFTYVAPGREFSFNLKAKF
ncbi:TonB-dependent siderophore receptor [Hoeflea sp. G2-23]|uniref:TonB-dependent siderophore receptor n=1 Tax=Hoeflea algicola TaxID=2983763 RepID=A0ABT3ZEY8_9HYPH|nr:TonB-dependent siderophore receptor [Hoeflea algicola]MCY0149869.1 TonB-dependent siderophore receptor [Hoeflea algicola]